MAGPNFRRGSEEAAKAAKGGRFSRTQFFHLEDGDVGILRFLTDAEANAQTGEGGWITVDQHQMVPTKPPPENYEGKWPQKMSAVCRKDEAFAGMYNECYICDFLVDGKKVKSAAGRTYALACVREEGREGGVLIGYKDAEREVTRKKDGKEVTEKEKDIVVVNLAWKNFFSALKGYAGFYGTVLDRDYRIKREGAGASDTTYSIIPMDPLPYIIQDGPREGQEIKFDVREPEVRARYFKDDDTDISLEDLIADRASDRYFAMFFDPRFTVKVGKDQDEDEGEVHATGATPEAPKPDNDADPARLTALAERVKGFGPNAQAQPAPAAQEAPAAPEAPAAAQEPSPEAPAAQEAQPAASGPRAL